MIYFILKQCENLFLPALYRKYRFEKISCHITCTDYMLKSTNYILQHGKNFSIFIFSKLHSRVF
jgi:hypothetical protein